MMNKRQVGSEKEEKAAKFLENRGLKILETNYRDRFGEIDIIARDNRYTVFVEVKYRKTARSGRPDEAVTFSKARTISRVADHYRIYRKLPDDAMFRFDVVAIEGENIRWHKNAFLYTS